MRLPRLFARFALLLLVPGLRAASPEAAAKPTAAVRVQVADAPTHPVSRLIFGQFLERFGATPKGEAGPQAALVPGATTCEWQPGAVDAMRQLRATSIRFPGGGALEGIADWTVMIDHSPLREDPKRPAGFEVGYDEFLRLCRELGAEPLIAVNFRSAVWGEKLPGNMTPEQMAAGLVAYCNLPVGAKLPPGMPDWPAIRAKNGHPEPYNVRWWQLGNEWVAWLGPTNAVQEKLGRKPFADDAALSAHLNARAISMLRAMRAVDPSIKLVVDAVLFRESSDTLIGAFLADPQVKELADFAAVHVYRPWGVERITLDGAKVSADDLTANQLWLCAVATPNLDEQGFSVIRHPSWDLARRNGWEVVMTEWNWNGWGVERHGVTPWARGVGAAGFLHAMLRDAAHLHLANQSMMIGDDWTIAAVRVSPTGTPAPFLMPTGQMTAFYAQHAGDRFVPVTVAQAPTVPQPVSMGSIPAAAKLALVDVIATESDQALTVHLINRDPKRDHAVAIELGAARRAQLAGTEARLHRLEGPEWQAASEPFLGPTASAKLAEPSALRAAGNAPGQFSVTLPAATVSALVIPLKPKTAAASR